MAMTKQTKPGSANITLAQPLARSAYTEKYLGLFWSDFLPGSRQFSDSASSLSPGAWTTVVYDRRANDRPINLAILALSLCDAGRRTSDSSLTHMGLEAYGRALLQLGSALRQPIRGDLSTAIGTTILFDAFEIFFGGNQPDKSMTPSRGWTEHTRGQLAIILSQPPEAFQAPGMHELFIDARYFTLLESFKARKRLSLLSPEWMTIPWGDRPKTPNDKLIDIVAEMTAIFEDLDRIETTQDLKARDQKRRLVLADCWHIDRRLQKWCTENSPLKEFRKDGVRIALDPTGPEDFALGHMTIVFWTASLGLYSQMQKLAAAERNLKLPPRMHPESYAQRIAYALPFLLRPGHLTMGATLAAAPLWMLMAIPEFNSPEVNNMLSLLMNSPETRTISNFMSSLDGDTEHWRTSKGWTI